jgi:hypothetical protein
VENNLMRTLLLPVIGVVLLAASAAAHHSYSATYDVAKEVTLEGKLLQFVYRNPHSFVTVQAPDQKGVQQRWAVEWSGTGQLASQVVIVGRPSRVAGEYRVLMVSLKRPLDGFTWGSRSGEAVD